MQIKINLQIFLFIIIFILTHQIQVYTWIMLFAFVHEIGHILAGIILKLKPKTLTLMPFGISVMFEDYTYKKIIEIKKIIIAIAGPLTNIFIATLMFFLNINNKEIIIYSNILIALFNLIPLYPLDGGRILKGIISLNYSKERTEEIINKISNIVIIVLTSISSIIILYLENIGILFLLLYLWIIVIKENRKYNLKKRMYEILQKKKNNILTFNELNAKINMYKIL